MTHEVVVYAAAASAVAFIAVYAAVPPLARFLEGRGMVVPDVNKKGVVMVARPGGPALVGGILASEAVAYALLPDVSILAIMATTAAAFVAGMIDDLKTMGGWFKPVSLAAAAAPIILLGAYDTSMAFPFFGDVQIPVLYLGVIVIMISVTGNTINSIDVVNGAASGFMAIAGSALSASLFLTEWLSGGGDYAVAVASLPLVFVSLAFYRYHRIPSRIFPGDSGAVVLGCMYGAIAITGGLEIIATIALLAAVVNSFLFLSSVKRIVEHRQLGSRPVTHTDDMKLRATRSRDAPVTLVRLLVASRPLSEGEVSAAILRLAAFSGGLAVATAVMAGVI